MRQYKSVETKEIQKKMIKIICNKCGKEICTENGEPREDYLSVEKTWGYFSGKDGQTDCFDLCEECYDSFVSTFMLPVGE